MNFRRFAPCLALMTAWLFPLAAEGFELLGYQWPGSHPRVPFFVSTNLAGHAPYNGPAEDGIRAITNAAYTWNRQGAGNFKFFYAGAANVTNAANDGINAVIFDLRPCPYPNTGCSAECVIHRGDDGNVEGFDVLLYEHTSGGARVIWTSSAFVGIMEMDIWTTVLHEFGHALGLAHSDVTSVMWRVPGFGGVRYDLTTDDIAGLQALYGPYTNEGIWASNTNPAPGDTVTLFLDYPRAARQPYQIVADFDGLSTGWELRTSWPADSRLFPLDRCPSPAGSREPTALEATVLSANSGVLDGNGQARVEVRIPENLRCFPTNRQWYFAAVTYGTNPPSGLEDVGVAVTLDIQTPRPLLFARRADAGAVELRWPVRADYSHQLESSATLAQWADFGPFLPALFADGWRTSVVSAAEPARFFRVRELPPPGLPCEFDGVLALVVSTNRVSVPEGGTASVTVRLNGPPMPGVTVRIARTGGDASLRVSGDNDHTSNGSDWNVPKTFTLRADADIDGTNGVATFTITGNGVSSVTVTASEVDDDGL